MLFSFPGDLPSTGIIPESPESPGLGVDSLPSEPPWKPFKWYTLRDNRQCGRMGDDGKDCKALASWLKYPPYSF